jgi:DNA (cytosine-5)-methyltransferase 1
MPKIIKHNSYLRRERERERERVNGISLFSNVGIDEIFLKRNNINIVGANELCKDRADFYRHVYPKCNMVCGDITNKTIFNKLIEIYKNNQCEFLLATPPCQGMSIAGKMNFNDERNSLITYVVNFIKKVKPKNILIENVPNILKFPINVDGKSIKIIDYIRQNLLPLGYKINASVLDAADFLTPQHRKRAIILLSKNQ